MTPENVRKKYHAKKESKNKGVVPERERDTILKRDREIPHQTKRKR